MWVRDNKVWYEAELIEKITEHIDTFCSTKCTYAKVEEDVCNDYCLLDDIVKPIIDLIQSYEGER